MMEDSIYMDNAATTPVREEALAAMLKLVGDEAKNNQPYQDILWALLNSTEFMTNH